MIRSILLLAFLSLFIFACENDSEENNEIKDSTEIAIEEIVNVPLADFEKMAGEFVGKEIKVNGIVDHVCKHGGKKILLVDGDHSLHVFRDERYDEELSGSEVSLIGIVEEEKIDSAYLVEWMNHEEGSHSGDSEKDVEHLEKMKAHIQHLMDSLQASELDYFPDYSLKYVSHEEKK